MKWKTESIALTITAIELAVMVYRCLQYRAPRYLISPDYCAPVSGVPGRQHLRSARRGQLSVPRVHRSTHESHTFSVAGPTVWNSLPDDMRDPAVDSEHFQLDSLTLIYIYMYLFSSKITHTSCQKDSKAQRPATKKCLEQTLATTYNMTETKHNKKTELNEFTNIRNITER